MYKNKFNTVIFTTFCHIGTNVMIYNLKLMDNGFPELDVLKDTKDIQMADPHASEVYDIDDMWVVSMCFLGENWNKQHWFDVLGIGQLFINIVVHEHFRKHRIS